MIKVAVGLGVAIAIAAGVVVGLVKIKDIPFLPPNGDDPPPQDEAGPEPESGSEPAPVGTDGPLPSGPAATTDPASSAPVTTIDPASSAPVTTGAPLESVVVLTPAGMVLVDATAEVGLGPGATFIYGRARAPEVLESEVKHAETGSCAFTDSIVIGLSEGETLDLETALADLPFDPDTFTADFRSDQNNYVSIGFDGVIVAGGFSIGGPGRGGSEQWIIEGGVFGVELSRRSGEFDDFYFEITATWAGPSIENFSGEESPGVVQIRCGFATLPG